MVSKLPESLRGGGEAKPPLTGGNVNYMRACFNPRVPDWVTKHNVPVTAPHPPSSPPIPLIVLLLSFQVSFRQEVPSVHFDIRLTSHRYAAMGLFSSRKTDANDTVTAVIAPENATNMNGGATEKSVVNVLRSRFVSSLSLHNFLHAFHFR